jgi:hypothetical protein
MVLMRTTLFSVILLILAGLTYTAGPALRTYQQWRVNRSYGPFVVRDAETGAATYEIWYGPVISTEATKPAAR